MGDIGKEKRETIEILPAEDPWPEQAPAPTTPEPTREPEEVPA